MGLSSVSQKKAPHFESCSLIKQGPVFNKYLEKTSQHTLENVHFYLFDMPVKCSAEAMQFVRQSVNTGFLQQGRQSFD